MSITGKKPSEFSTATKDALKLALGINDKQTTLTPTAVKTSDYTASANELIPCDISGGAFTVTLPSAPADGTMMQVEIVNLGTGVVPTPGVYLAIKTSGVDTFQLTGGPKTIYISLAGENIVAQYIAATKVWLFRTSSLSANFATNFPGIDSNTPITNSDISINTTTRVLTIVPPLGFFNIYIDGGGMITRFRKTGTITFPAFTDTSGMWYFYFNNTGTAVTTQTPWTTDAFPSMATVYRILWNASLYNFTITSGSAVDGDTYTNNGQTFTVKQTISSGVLLKTSGTGDPSSSGTLTRSSGTGDATLTFSAYSIAPRLVAEYIEYHLNDIPADAHQWFHLQGSQWVTGFTMVNNALSSGSPAVNGSNTVIALTTGTNVDDNLEYTVTNSVAGTAWTQDLGTTTAASLTASNSAMFSVYRQSAAGLVNFIDSTRFPFDWNIVTNIPNYITATGVRTPVTNQRFMVNFVYATQNPTSGSAIKVVSATTDFATIVNARAYSWVDIQNTYSTLGYDGEIRPLYRLIHEVHSGSPSVYDAGAKYSVLRETQDLRKAAVTTSTTISGSLPASSVTYIPTSPVTSTNVQSAITEVYTIRNIDLVTAKDTGYTITLADHGTIFTCSATTPQNFNLPSVDATNTGYKYTIVKLGTGAVTITAADSDTIEDSGAGLTIYCADEGIATITLELVTATQWIIKFANGTWVTTV